MSEAAPKRQAVVVGLFVAVGAAILTGGILTIGDIHDTFARKIEVSAVFDGVNGLQAGDNIWFSGVKVGTVKDVAFLADSRVQVEMKVDRAAAPYIHDDALAKVSSDGLIGNKIVVLYGGTVDAPVVKDGDVITVGAAVSTEDMMAMAQENNANLLAITTDLKGITAKVAAGEGSAGKLLQDDALYAKVNATVDSMNAASAHAESLTASLATFSAKLNQEGSLPNDLVTDRSMYASLSTSAAKLEATTTQAATLVDGLQAGVSDPATPLGTLMHDNDAGTDLKATLDNLHESSELLSDDLEAMQHNILLRGFFKKKDKDKDDRKPNEPQADAAAAAAADVDVEDPPPTE
jgi:phospholipid/cholesterol/gamma-HCH transport system substrate-binding protein